MTTHTLIFNTDLRIRLDAYISNELNEFSRSYIQRLIKDGFVKVNDKAVDKPGYELKAGDIVSLSIDKKVKEAQILKPVKMKLNIVYEDIDLLVIDKPVGISVHPSIHNWEERTIAAGILSYLGEDFANIGDPLRPGIVHRLDKDTSGLLVVAKNQDTLWNLSQQFKQRKVKKEYLAVVSGDIESRLGKTVATEGNFFEIELWIQRNPVNPRKYYAENLENGGRFSKTKLQILNQGEFRDHSFTALKMLPETGRTHQLRVVTKYFDSPIIGDRIYGGIDYSRLMLHAVKLSIFDNSGKQLSFESELPEEFKNFL